MIKKEEADLEDNPIEVNLSLDKCSGKETSEVKAEAILGTSADLTRVKVDQGKEFSGYFRRNDKLINRSILGSMKIHRETGLNV